MKIISPALDLNEEATLVDIPKIIQSLEDKEDPFAILEQDELTYIQTLWTPNGYHLEYQEGDVNRHFQSTSPLSKEQVAYCFQSYFSSDQNWKSQIEFEQKIIRDTPFNLGRSIGQFFGGFLRGFNKA